MVYMISTDKLKLELSILHFFGGFYLAEELVHVLDLLSVVLGLLALVGPLALVLPVVPPEAVIRGATLPALVVIVVTLLTLAQRLAATRCLAPLRTLLAAALFDVLVDPILLGVHLPHGVIFVAAGAVAVGAVPVARRPAPAVVAVVVAVSVVVAGLEVVEPAATTAPASGDEASAPVVLVARVEATASLELASWVLVVLEAGLVVGAALSGEAALVLAVVVTPPVGRAAPAVVPAARS